VLNQLIYTRCTRNNFLHTEFLAHITARFFGFFSLEVQRWSFEGFSLGFSFFFCFVGMENRDLFFLFLLLLFQFTSFPPIHLFPAVRFILHVLSPQLYFYGGACLLLFTPLVSANYSGAFFEIDFAFFILDFVFQFSSCREECTP
jgi:hypothetical protein